jgi:hypothetical protein
MVHWRLASESGGEALELEADSRHAEIIVEQMGLTMKSRGAVTPGIKVKYEGVDVAIADEKRKTLFKSTAMRGAYLASDRPELAYATKECARALSCPTERAWEAVKRLARFLIANPRLVQRFVRQAPVSIGDVYCDSDWAGCPITRRSTSCVAMMLGKHTVRVSSTTQGPISLASGEAELHAGVKGGSMAIGFQSMASDLGMDIKLRLHTDSSAAKGIMSRRGCGKVRHLETKVLWIQKAVTDKVFQLCKVEGLVNPADIGTKHNDSATMQKHLNRLGYFVMLGRSSLEKGVSNRDA